MTQKHEVLRILQEPQKVRMNLGEEFVEYWKVKVILRCCEFEYESYVTFLDEKEAYNLSVGKEFNR